MTEHVRWTEIGPDDFDGVGDHALYKVHRLSRMETGVGKVDVRSDKAWMTARKVGQLPFKMVGGPYATADEARARAEALEASL